LLLYPQSFFIYFISVAVANKEQRLGFLNILVLILSVYVLGALLVDAFFKLPTEVSRMIDFTDNIVCGVFFVEFCVRFHYADNKWKFMKWGWIDLIASIPAIDYLRAGRALRLIRLIRVVRAFRSTKNLMAYIFRNRTQGAFASVVVIGVLCVFFSAIAVLQVEDDPTSNIKTAEDALWWAYVTLTTVGYGDRYPVTTEGRIIAAVLMTVGIGLVGTFAGFVASWFVGSPGSKKVNDD
jgi:voltage-gated potassium channel